jgi:hypothetical protein
MALTTEQLATLRAVVLAEPSLTQARQNGDDYAIAAWCNAAASPAFYVWRSDYTSERIRAAITAGITQLDALTASKRDSLLWWAEASQDMTQSATRAAVNDLTGSQNTLKNSVLDGGKRTATNAEKVLATGAGSFADPAVPGFVGEVSIAEAGYLR